MAWIRPLSESRTSIRAWTFASVLLILTSLAPARADAAPPDDPAGEEQAESTAEKSAALEIPTVLDEIIVTAQKREEDLQEVPLAVTAFSAVQIEEAGIENPEDFIALTPNISIANSFTVGNSFVTVRGVTQINNSDPSVAVVVDGVYQGNQKQLTQELFDIERIEVLKGPQGALYGRNSLGGALNIITKQPTDELEGFVRLSAGNGSSQGLSAALSGALVKDKLLFRLAASYKDSDGLIDNVFVGAKADPFEDSTERLLLKWLPTDRTRLDFRVSISDTEGGAVLYSIFPTNGFANDFSFEPDQNILGFSEREMEDFTLRLVHEGEALTLTSITGVSNVTETYRGDGDFSNPSRTDLFFPFGQLGQGQDLDVELFSQEIRFTSPGDRRLRWIGGAYLLETDRRLDSFAAFDTNGTVGGFFPFFSLFEDNDNTAFAFFGQLDFQVSDKWEIGGALRYDKDERNQLNLASGQRLSASFDKLQPKLTVRYQARDNVMAYFNASTGFRSGGFNAPTVTPQIFDKEVSDNLEIGFKSTLMDQHLRLNGAAYLTRSDDFQLFLFDPFRGGQIIENIAETEMLGLELDLTARLAGGWDVYAGLGINEADIRDFDGSGRFVGNQTPSNTRLKANLGAQLTAAVSARLLAIGRVDLELRGKQYWHPDNLDVQDPIQLVNARFTLESRAWSVTLWSKNLTDEEYYVEFADAAWSGTLAGGDLGHLGRPRTFGVDLKRRF